MKCIFLLNSIQNLCFAVQIDSKKTLDLDRFLCSIFIFRGAYVKNTDFVSTRYDIFFKNIKNTPVFKGFHYVPFLLMGPLLEALWPPLDQIFAQMEPKVANLGTTWTQFSPRKSPFDPIFSVPVTIYMLQVLKVIKTVLPKPPRYTPSTKN